MSTTIYIYNFNTPHDLGVEMFQTQQKFLPLYRAVDDNFTLAIKSY